MQLQPQQNDTKHPQQEAAAAADVESVMD